MAQVGEPAAADNAQVDSYQEVFMAAARAGDCERVSQALEWVIFKGHDDDSSCTSSDALGVVNHFLEDGTPVLVWAAEQSDVPLAVVQLLLEEGSHIDLPDASDETALYKAIKRRCEELVDLLVERGADVNAENYLDNSPLILALTEGHLPIVRRLLSSGRSVRVNHVNSRMQTALCCAVSAGHVDVARVLLKDHGADPIYCLANTFKPDGTIEGVDIETSSQCFDMIKAVRSAAPSFISAVRGGDVREVERLLEHGGWGVVNALYLEGRLAPLMVAAQRGDMPMAELLMRHGARPEMEKAPDPREGHVKTALTFATQGGHEEMARRLLAKGEWAPGGEGLREALLQACGHGRAALLSEYLSRLHFHGRTWGEGLRRAGEGGHGQCFDMLLQHADPGHRRGLIDGVMRSGWLLDRPRSDEQFGRVVGACLQHVGPGELDLSQPHWLAVAYEACRAHLRFPVLRRLLEQGVNRQKALQHALVSVVRENDRCPLPSERCDDRVARTRYLLSRGVGSGELTPDWASSESWARGAQWDMRILRTLLDSGTWLSSTGLLEALARQGRLEELGLLLERGVDLDEDVCRRALFAAAGTGMEGAVALLLKHGIKGCSPLCTPEGDGGSSSFCSHHDGGGKALFKACFDGHRKVVRRLLEWGGASVLYKDGCTGTTALYECVDKGDWEAAVLLLGAGAELDAGRMMCRTSLEKEEAMNVDQISAAEWNSIVEDLKTARRAAEREDVVTSAMSRLGARGGGASCALNARDAESGLTVLMAAAIRGHVQVARHLVGCGVKLDLRGRDGMSALGHACVQGRTEVVKLLVEAGADTTARDRDGHTALELACTGGHAAAASLVLPRHRAQVDRAAEHRAQACREREERDGGRMLRDACVRGDVGVVSLLVQEGMHAGVSLAHVLTAAARGHAAVVQALLQSREMREQAHEACFMPALQCAVAMGHVEVMEALLHKAPSLLRQPDSSDNKTTLLMTAAAWEQVACVRRLLGRGAGEGLGEGKGEGWEGLLLLCARTAAVPDRQADIVGLLLAAAAQGLSQRPGGQEGEGASSSSRLADVCTRMLWESRHTSPALVKLLMDYGARTESHARKGVRPLMSAVIVGRCGVVEALLERETRWGPGYHSNYGPWGDPFYKACSTGKADLIRVFVEKGAVERYSLEAVQQVEERKWWMDAIVQGLHAVAQARDVVSLKGLLEIGGQTLREEMRRWGREVDIKTGHLDISVLGTADGSTDGMSKEARTQRAVRELTGEAVGTVGVREGPGATGDASCSEDPDADTEEAPLPPDPEMRAALSLQLLEACNRGRSDEVRLLLPRGAAVTSVHGDTERTPLMAAARAGSVACVGLLLGRLREEGQWDELERRDVLGRTALWHACCEDHADVVELLLSQGANPHVRCFNVNVGDVDILSPRIRRVMDARDPWVWGGDWEVFNLWKGKSPLDVVEMRGTECLQAFKNVGLAANYVIVAMQSRPTECEPVSRVLDRPWAPSSGREWLDGHNEPLVHRAIMTNCPGAVEVLLQRGAGVQVRDRGEALFALAVDRGCGQVAWLLLSYGAKADARDEEGRTPLMVATVDNDDVTVAAVLRHPEGRRTLEMKDEHSRTPLWAACKYGHVQVALELLVAGADFRGRGGRADLTPLQLARRRRDAKIIPLLMSCVKEGLYYLHKCRLVHDFSALCPRLPPPLEARRLSNQPPPRLETGATGESLTGTGRRRKRSAAGEVDPQVVLVRAVMRFVVHDLKADLYRELVELWQPYVDLRQLEELPEYEDSDDEAGQDDEDSEYGSGYSEDGTGDFGGEEEDGYSDEDQGEWEDAEEWEGEEEEEEEGDEEEDEESEDYDEDDV